jgi:hypothetical protein
MNLDILFTSLRILHTHFCCTSNFFYNNNNNNNVALFDTFIVIHLVMIIPTFYGNQNSLPWQRSPAILNPICPHIPWFLRIYFNIVTCILIARQRLGKYISARANARNSRTSIARQRISKYASLTIEAVFSAWFVKSGYNEVFGSTDK